MYSEKATKFFENYNYEKIRIMSVNKMAVYYTILELNSNQIAFFYII